MIVHGRMQHWQSSPHQHGSLTGGLDIGPFAIDGEVPDDVADVVEGGIVEFECTVRSTRVGAVAGCRQCRLMLRCKPFLRDNLNEVALRSNDSAMCVLAV